MDDQILTHLDQRYADYCRFCTRLGIVPATLPKWQQASEFQTSDTKTAKPQFKDKEAKDEQI